MSYLRLPRRRWTDTKPTEPVEFDRGFVEEAFLVGAWILNDPAPRDLSGHGHHASRVGTTAATTATPHGQGYSFGGGANNHRLDLGSITSDDPLSLSSVDQSSFLFRAYLATGATDFPRVIDKSDGGNGQNGWVVYLDNRAGQKDVNLYYNTAVQIQNVGPYPNDEWFDCIVRQDDLGLDGGSNTAEVHINGTSVGTGTATAGTASAATTNCAIGNWNASDRQWMGDMEYVYVCGRGIEIDLALAIQREPYRYLVPRKSRTYFIPAAVAPGANDLVGPLAGQGGLAGMGGLAGRHGGLAA